MERRKLLKYLFVLPLTACGPSNSNNIYTIVTDASIKPGDIVPKSSEKVILTLRGRVNNKNQANGLDFDMKTFERMGLVKYVVKDPELRRDVEYTGVLLQTVLDVAQYDRNSTILRASALNDYKIDIPLDVLRWPVMIATQRDGQRIPIVEKGPLEIVFPTKHFSFDPILYDPMWVWQLRELEVR